MKPSGKGSSGSITNLLNPEIYARPFTSTITETHLTIFILALLIRIITFREIKSKHTLPVLYGPTLGPGCLTVAVNSLPIIDLFLKVSPIRQQCYINICDD